MPRYIPGRIDLLHVRAGDAFSVTFRFGEEVDLTGLEAKAHVRKETDAAAALVTFTGATAVISGQDITISQDSTVMAALAPGRYVYDVQVQTPSTPDVQTLVFGDFTVLQNVTR